MTSVAKPMMSAAVLIPLYRHPEVGLRLVLVRRSEGGVHGGQLAFPGGKPEPQDQSLLETALRETREEIGLPSERIMVLEHLPVTKTRTTGFRISPFLAKIQPPSRWQWEPREIAEVVELDLVDLARPEAHGEAVQQSPTWPKPQLTPFYQVGSYRIWGVTYRILHPLLPRLLAGEWVL